MKISAHDTDSVQTVGMLFVSVSILLVTLLGNLTVMIRVLIRERSTPTVSNKYISSLVTSDFIMGVLVMPGMVLLVSHGYWPLGSSMCSVWIFLNFYFGNVSILRLCLIAYDRYLAIVHPLRYRCIPNPRYRAYKLIGVTWCVACVAASTLTIVRSMAIHTSNSTDEHYYNYTAKHQHACHIDTPSYYALFHCLLTFHAPAIIMLYMYVKSHCRLKGQLKLMMNKKCGFGARRVSAGELIQQTRQRDIIEDGAQGCTVNTRGPFPDGETVKTTRPLRDGESVNTTGPLRDGESVNTTGPLPDGESVNTTGPLRDGESVNTTGPLPNGESVNTTRPLPDGESFNTTGPLRDGESVNTTRPLPDGESFNTTGPLRDGESVNTTGPLCDGESVNTTGPLRDGESVNTTGPLRDGESVNTTGPLRDGESVNTTRPLRDGESVNTTGPLHNKDHSNIPEDTHVTHGDRPTFTAKHATTDHTSIKRTQFDTRFLSDSKKTTVSHKIRSGDRPTYEVSGGKVQLLAIRVEEQLVLRADALTKHAANNTSQMYCGNVSVTSEEQAKPSELMPICTHRRTDKKNILTDGKHTTNEPAGKDNLPGDRDSGNVHPDDTTVKTDETLARCMYDEPGGGVIENIGSQSTIAEIGAEEETRPGKVELKSALSEKRRCRRLQRSLRILGVMITSFMVCSLPFSICWPIWSICPTCISYKASSHVFLLLYINASTYPFIYLITQSKVKHRIIALFRCK